MTGKDPARKSGLDKAPAPSDIRANPYQSAVMGDELLIDGVRHLYPALRPSDAVHTAEMLEATISHGMQRGEFPALATVYSDRVEVRIIGLDRPLIYRPVQEGPQS